MVAEQSVTLGWQAGRVSVQSVTLDRLAGWACVCVCEVCINRHDGCVYIYIYIIHICVEYHRGRDIH